MSTATLQAPLLPPGKLQLKYLFSALLSDGTEYHQTPEDVSPYTEGRNAMYELLEQDSNGTPIPHPNGGWLKTRADVVLFQLSDGVHRYLVDLRDGHFEVQHVEKKKELVGAHFFVGVPPAGETLRFFYYRRRRHHANVSALVGENGEPQMSSCVEVGQECEYRFGWETEDRKHCGELILL